MVRKNSPDKGERRKYASPGSRLAYDDTRQEMRKRSKRKKSKRKRSKLQKAHIKFMKKKLSQFNRKGGSPQSNMKKAARAWKKSPQRKKAMRKRKKHKK